MLSKFRKKSTEGSTSTPNTQKDAKDLERAGRMLFAIAETGHKNRKRLYWISFWKGLWTGFGSVIGATVVVSIVLWLLTLLGDVSPLSALRDLIQDNSTN